MISADLSNNDAVVLALFGSLITGLIVGAWGYYTARSTAEANLKATRESNENALKIAQETSRATLQAIEKQATHERELEVTKARRSAIYELGTNFILAADDALDFLENKEDYEKRKEVNEMRAVIAGAHVEHVPTAATIHTQLRRLGGRAQFLKLASAMHLEEYAATFNQAATLENLSDTQRESRVARLNELQESITNSLGNAAR